MLNSDTAIPIPACDPLNYVDIEGWTRKLTECENTITYSMFDCSREVYRNDCVLNKDLDPMDMDFKPEI
jgi:hypothetical protein